MSHGASFGRRRALVLSAGACGGLLTGSRAWAFDEPRTEDQVLGPFYPLAKPLDRDADLTQIRGRRGRAEGQLVHVTGRVLGPKDRPLAGIRVEVWQANTHGRYRHPNDTNPAPLDPNFQGYGVQVTDESGRFRFRTIKPGAYATGIDGWTRPPHIHFDVTGRHEELVTQMYFPGEALNEQDRLLQSAAPGQATLVARAEPAPKELEPGALLVRWDIVLLRG